MNQYIYIYISIPACMHACIHTYIQIYCNMCTGPRKQLLLQNPPLGHSQQPLHTAQEPQSRDDISSLHHSWSSYSGSHDPAPLRPPPKKPCITKFQAPVHCEDGPLRVAPPRRGARATSWSWAVACLVGSLVRQKEAKTRVLGGP